MVKHLSHSFLLALFLSFLSLNVIADPGQALNDAQKKELYHVGKITDSNGVIWNIRAIPGIDNICRWSENGLKECKETFGNLIKSDFWAEVYNQTGNCVKFSKAACWDFGIKGCYDDFCSTSQDNSKLDDNAMGSGTLKALNWCKFGLRTCGRVIGAPMGVTLGAVGTLIVPTFMVLWQPTKGIYQGLGRGVVFPAIAWVWHNGAYVLNMKGSVPTHESPYLVSIEVAPNSSAKYALNLDSNTFEKLLSQIILEEMNKKNLEPKQKEIKECYEKINTLKSECEKQEETFYSDSKRKSIKEDNSFSSLFVNVNHRTVVTADHKVLDVLEGSDLIKLYIDQLKKDGILSSEADLDLKVIADKIKFKVDGLAAQADKFLYAEKGKLLDPTPNPIPLPLHASGMPVFDPIKETGNDLSH